RRRWDDAARRLETWRQADLGLAPDDGALGADGLDAAIGPEPCDPTDALRRQAVIKDLPVEFAPARSIEVGIEPVGLDID
ncbi:MAG: hypothetical protein M3Z84_04280, partial [Actinomycetota bacterium]|nr:hypothetical protein [Actinomycetota bacterium]